MFVKVGRQKCPLVSPKDGWNGYREMFARSFVRFAGEYNEKVPRVMFHVC